MARGVKTGGRKPGSKNKVAADVKALAQSYGPEAIDRLVAHMRGAANEQTSVAAAKELLDRGYGKSVAPIEHTGETDHNVTFGWRTSNSTTSHENSSFPSTTEPSDLPASLPTDEPEKP
jgi:hypothetical protein